LRFLREKSLQNRENTPVYPAILGGFFRYIHSLGHNNMALPITTATNKKQCAVIGGGVIGLSIAWRLLQAGVNVTIFERNTLANGATNAAAGMLAPQIEAEPSEEKLLNFLLQSKALWQNFVTALEAASGMTVDYRTEGTLEVAMDGDQVRHIRDRYTYLQNLGLHMTWLSAAECRAHEPYLGRSVQGGIYSASDHQVDNRKLATALEIAVRKTGGIIREHTDVLHFMQNNGRVTGVQLATGTENFDTVIVTTGAWTQSFLGKGFPMQVSVRPVKGQMLCVQMDAANPLIRHVVRSPDIYMVPRLDGRLLIGATVEEKGFDTKVTFGGMRQLIEAAWEVLPALDEYPVIETWAGLRPGTLDDAPILGKTPIKNLLLAAGHYRHGILLTPLTAKIISEIVLQ
jgi:glycine oxidase